MVSRPPALLALDWGSSSLRAFAMDEAGHVLQARASTAGASTIQAGAAAFQSALDALIPDWHGLSAPLWACGMVGSRHGWHEAPYLPCPATPQALAAQAVAVDWRGRVVNIVPGLCCSGDVPDVMRGEETQVAGALALRPALGEGACFVLPGTHAKWVVVRAGAVQSFATHLTGELYALLRVHSVLGRNLSGEPQDKASAFARGVQQARDGHDDGLLRQLFGVRAMGLTGRLPAGDGAEHLSGLLIGHELLAGLRWRRRHSDPAAPLVVVGESDLGERVRTALALLGCDDVLVLPNTAAQGLRAIARSAEALAC